MADEVDRQLEREGPIEEARIREVMRKASQIPVGVSGDCDLCGEWSGRLVNGACAPCRDRHGLP